MASTSTTAATKGQGKAHEKRIRMAALYEKHRLGCTRQARQVAVFQGVEIQKM
jgi:hypothetical protein